MGILSASIKYIKRHHRLNIKKVTKWSKTPLRKHSNCFEKTILKLRFWFFGVVLYLFILGTISWLRWDLAGCLWQNLIRWYLWYFKGNFDRNGTKRSAWIWGFVAFKSWLFWTLNLDYFYASSFCIFNEKIKFNLMIQVNQSISLMYQSRFWELNQMKAMNVYVCCTKYWTVKHVQF
jgi:hypothetical protein